MHRFSQVDVFTDRLTAGNPLAVVHAADDLSDTQLAAVASWTNLSETTFLLPPTTDEADYRLRIFTPSSELPFAGHPTIGSAHAWLEAGGSPRSAEHVVQECGAGLVRLRRTSGRLAFAAPPLLRSGPVSDVDRAAVLGPLGLSDDEVLDMSWVDNGPGWVGVLLRDADAVLAVEPEFTALRHDVGLVGVRSGGDTACEVRGLCPAGSGITEDPVTGSLNAGLAQWLSGTVLPPSYVAAQGTVIGRTGRVHVERTNDDGDDTIWVGGDARTVVRGEVSID